MNQLKIVAQGFQRSVAPLRVVSQVATAQPVRVAAPVVSKVDAPISAPVLMRALPSAGVNTLRLRAK